MQANKEEGSQKGNCMMKVLVHYIARNLGKGLILTCPKAWI